MKSTLLLFTIISDYQFFTGSIANKDFSICGLSLHLYYNLPYLNYLQLFQKLKEDAKLLFFLFEE